MKKHFTLKGIGLATMLMFSFTAIQSQDTTDEPGYNSKGRFGIRAGVTISKQNFDGGSLNEDVTSKFGLDLGILYTLPIGSGLFNLQPELHWMQKGSTIADVNGDDISQTFNYLELPVLVRLNFGGSAKVFVLAGPSIGYLIGVDSDIDNAKDLYEDIDYSMNIGAGIGLGVFEIDVRYMWGLSDIADATHPSDAAIKNSSFGAGLTFKF